MEDSSLFMEWAMETLQHLHPLPATPPPAAGDNATFPSLQALRESSVSQNGMAPPEPTAHEGHRASNSWSSGDTDSVSGGGGAAMEHDGWSTSPNSVRCAPGGGGGGVWPVSWNFSSAMTQPCNEATPPNPPTTTRARHGGGGVRYLPAAVSPSPSAQTRRASSKGNGGGGSGSSSAAPYAQEHIIAERKRREKINQRFIELSTVIPGLKKMDKATILSDAVRYVKELQEKLSELEQHQNGGVESAILLKKPCIAASSSEGGCPASASAVAGSSSSGTTARSSLPEIEAKISHGNVMVRIHSENNGKGSLVRLLAAVEGLHLGITHTNVMPFSACTAVITIMAKVEDGVSVTAEDIVGKLNIVLQQNSRNSARETKS
uniref:BHLH domain-containing protein n=1 Tax=Oryza glumipatula TaxID=40148 RepID=A0A0D9ZBE7_9ORYZ